MRDYHWSAGPSAIRFLFPTSLCGVLTFGAAPADRPNDRPTDLLLLAPPLSFFYTHTRHTHVNSLTHTRHTHSKHTHTFAHGARARLTLDTLSFFYTHTRHTHVNSLTDPGRCPSTFRGPPLPPGLALQALDGARARFGAPPP